jgi:hypothetical protein
MATKTIDKDELLRRFKRLIERSGGSYKAAARCLGYSPALLNMCAKEKTPIPDPLLHAMGLRREIEIRYVEIDEDERNEN